MGKDDFDWHAGRLSGDTVITATYRTTPQVRRFVHDHVPGFTFSRPFQAWIGENVGMTLSDLVVEAARRSRQM
jgi:hypothetical protein